MTPRRRLTGRLLIPSCMVFLVLDVLFVTIILLYFPRSTKAEHAQNNATAALAVQDLNALLSGAAGVKAVEQQWRTNCDAAAMAVLEAEPRDTAVGIFQGSSPLCLHIRLDAPVAHHAVEPAVLNPESLAGLRRSLAAPAHIAVAAPSEWPGLVAIASALDVEGDQTALLLRVIPVSLLAEKLLASGLGSQPSLMLVDDKGSILAGAPPATGEASDLLKATQTALRGPDRQALLKPDREVRSAPIGQTNASVILIADRGDLGRTRFLWVLIGATTALLAIGVAASAWIIHRVIFIRLRTLKRVARVHGKGHFSVRFRPREYMPREILSLGLALNEMADSSTRQAEALQEAAAEETRLLLELHHRVKNNFQVVESLLSLLKKGNPPDKINHLRFVEDHVRSMAVADRAAYGAHGMHVPIDELISGVIDGLRTATGLSGAQVRLELGASLGTLDLDRAVALCLCLAVAAPPYFAALKEPGDVIRISAEMIEPGLLRLTIVGPALPLDTSPFLRERLIQAYLKQLDAMPNSGWQTGDTSGLSILIPGVGSLRAA